MSNDAAEAVTKKKSKKVKSDDTVGSVTSEPDVAEGEKKKKKKKKRKSEDAVEDAMIADEVVGGSEYKKRSKKEKTTADSMIEDGEKKKKRKRDAEPTTDASEPSESKKDKKKRKKEENLTQGNDQPSADKKDKKKKKKSEEGHDTASGSSASPTAATVDQFLKKNNITIHVAPSSSPVTPILSFDQLAIPDELRGTFSAFKEPSPIQACTWPPALEGKDVVGIAETGSGKTLAFGIPALTRIIRSPPPSSNSSSITTLVVAPTRELALQTHDNLSAIGGPIGIGSVAVFGGVPKDPQIKLLKNLDKGKKGITTRIIVGTPGRIIDLINEGVCDLSCVDYLVLDEADRMLDKGFENDIRRIISYTKDGSKRQTMMFSATWPESVRLLASTFQKDPVRVTVGSDDLTANSRVEQIVEVLDSSYQKESQVLSHLRTLKHPKGVTTAKIMVFILYQKEAAHVENILKRNGYTVSSLQGGMSQNARLESLESFKSGKTGILVATDVAARGLDIPNVAAVINYTFPLTLEDYIHRIGRTGRGGKSGKSITFFTGENHERSLAGELAKVLRESGFKWNMLDKFPLTIKKKEHGSYGAFYRDDIPMDTGRKKIVF